MNVWTFSLTPVPLSLASIYGKMKKTPKSKLSRHLEALITHTEPAAVDIVLYDAMLITQSLPSDLPLRFSNIAELVLRIICSTRAGEVHFVCDSYVKSIKNVEQEVQMKDQFISLVQTRHVLDILNMPWDHQVLKLHFLSSSCWKNGNMMYEPILQHMRNSVFNIQQVYQEL